MEEGVQFATLTDIIYKTWADKTAKEYKKFKGLKKENLRDNMTNAELVLNMLAELSTKQISEAGTIRKLWMNMRKLPNRAAKLPEMHAWNWRLKPVRKLFPR